MAADEIHKERMKSISGFYNSLSGTFISAGIIGPTIGAFLRPMGAASAGEPLPAWPLVAVVVGCAIGAALFQIASYIQMGTIHGRRPSPEVESNSKIDLRLRTMENTLYIMAAIPIIAGVVAVIAAAINSANHSHRVR